MFAVVVTLAIRPDHWAEFLPLLQQNANASRALEPECHQFDISTDPTRPHEVFLYELYSDETAFHQHLSTAHFKAFDAATDDMIADKTVKTYATVIR